MSCGTVVDLGTYTVGEKPAPLVYQYLDHDGVVIDLTGYQVRFVFQPIGGPATTANGSLVVAANGTVQYTWLGTEFNITGKWEAQFWVGNGTNRWASDLIKWTVRSSVGPVPAI
jgi:hypothetical protein